MSYVSKDGIGMGMPKTYGNGANAVQPIVESDKHSAAIAATPAKAKLETERWS